MPILEIFTCVWQHQINQLSSASLYQTLSRSFKDPLQALTWAVGNFNPTPRIGKQLLVPIQIQGTRQEKRKKVHTPPPMSCILCLKTKKKTKKIKKKNKKIKKQKQTKKNASDFSTRQRSTPLLPMQRQGFLCYTYICVLAGRPCWPEEVSACSSVSN